MPEDSLGIWIMACRGFKAAQQWLNNSWELINSVGDLTGFHYKYVHLQQRPYGIFSLPAKKAKLNGYDLLSAVGENIHSGFVQTSSILCGHQNDRLFNVFLSWRKFLEIEIFICMCTFFITVFSYSGQITFCDGFDVFDNIPPGVVDWLNPNNPICEAETMSQSDQEDTTTNDIINIYRI